MKTTSPPAAVKQAAAERVFVVRDSAGPWFVVAHLQLGLMLQKLGPPLDEKKEGVRLGST